MFFFCWRFWECLEILSFILRNSEKATKESSHRSKTRPRNGKKKKKIWLSLLRIHLKNLSIRRKVMGSRVDKSPLFIGTSKFFFRVTLSVDDPLQSPKICLKNWENSRAMMKRNWSEFFSVLEGSTSWFSVSTREANFLCFLITFESLWRSRWVFFCSIEQRKRDYTSETLLSQPDGKKRISDHRRNLIPEQVDFLFSSDN